MFSGGLKCLFIVVITGCLCYFISMYVNNFPEKKILKVVPVEHVTKVDSNLIGDIERTLSLADSVIVKRGKERKEKLKSINKLKEVVNSESLEIEKLKSFVIKKDSTIQVVKNDKEALKGLLSQTCYDYDSTLFNHMNEIEKIKQEKENLLITVELVRDSLRQLDSIMNSNKRIIKIINK